MGGGVLLDLSHELDYLQFLLGKPIKDVKINTGKVSDITVDSEDYADILFSINKTKCNVHLNFMSHLNRREIIIDYKDKTIIKDVVVSEQVAQIKVDYLGAFNSDDQNVDTLQNNKIYTFKFRVSNPISSNKFGFVFKIGAKQSAQADIVYIKKIDNTFGSVVYYSAEPYTTAVSSDSESKLVNMMFNSVTSGTYEIEIPVRIRNAAINDEVPVYFTSYLSTKPNFMDNSKFMKAQYYIDSKKICNGVFC